MSWPRNLFPPRQHPTDHHGPSIPDEPDDAELIAVATAAQDGFQALLASATNLSILSDDDHDALYDRTYAFSDGLIAMRATTPEGFAAKAMVLRLVMQFQIPSKPGETVEECGDHHDLLAWSLSSDLVAGGAKLADNPDAELITACAAFDALERAYVTTYATDIPEGTSEWAAAEAERDRLLAAEKPFLDRMTELRAVTLEGQAARARSLVLWAPDLVSEGTTGDTIGLLTHAVLRDLIGEARS